jgi:hypothetical protein
MKKYLGFKLGFMAGFSTMILLPKNWYFRFAE